MGAAEKILLTVGEVVEHSLEVADEDAEKQKRKTAAERVARAERELAFFQQEVAATLDIAPEEITEPRLTIEHDGLRFNLFWHHRDGCLSIMQVCPACGESSAWSWPKAIRDHRALGYALREGSEDLRCQDCCRLAARPPVVVPQTVAQRLEELIREIAREEIVGDREFVG